MTSNAIGKFILPALAAFCIGGAAGVASVKAVLQRPLHPLPLTCNDYSGCRMASAASRRPAWSPFQAARSAWGPTAISPRSAPSGRWR